MPALPLVSPRRAIAPALLALALVLASPDGRAQQAARAAAEPSVLDLDLTTLEGAPLDLGQYRGKALLIVNVASKCGFTPQYAGLEALYQRYKERGLVVLGVPSNDFLGQEPGTPQEIRAFVTQTYGVTFPLAAKQQVKGSGKCELYEALTEQGPEAFRGEISWNFNKFLIDPAGRVVARFGSRTKPDDEELIAAIEKALPPPSAR